MDSSETDTSTCVICRNCVLPENGPTCNLTEKGISTLINAAENRGEDLGSLTIGQKVHVKCRKEFTCNRRIDQATRKQPFSLNESVTLRSKMCFLL